ncbi:hypothetical protein [Kitasatospora sp. NPDC094011]|uniref:hypothetical protein n=1 Tax=Kitasatospora sp. NPDC094011 TaxID=3364090 RepID=UPI00382418D6
MTSLTIGGIYTARLQHAAGPWTIHGTVTIWADQDHADASTTVTVQISDHPDHRRPGHSTYATGSMSELPDGTRGLVHLITPQPGPTEISLGYRLLGQRDPADAALHLAAARALLADWEPIPADDEPLGVSALPALARAVQRAAAGRAAEADRDRLVRRLRAGKVPRDLVAQVDGRDPSRITQLCKPIREKMSV